MKFLVRLVPDSTQCLLVALRSLSTKQYSNLGSQANILFTILLCKDCNSLNAIKQVATSRRGTKQFLNIVVELALQLYQTDSLVYLKFVFLFTSSRPVFFVERLYDFAQTVYFSSFAYLLLRYLQTRSFSSINFASIQAYLVLELKYWLNGNHCDSCVCWCSRHVWCFGSN